MITISIAQARRTAFYAALARLKQHLPTTGTSGIIVHLVLAADAHQLAAPAVLIGNAGVLPAGEEPEEMPTKLRVSIPISIPEQQEQAFSQSLERLKQRWPSSSTSALIVSLVINTAALLDDSTSDTVHRTEASPPPMPSAGTPGSLDGWVRLLLDPDSMAPDLLITLWRVSATGFAQRLYPLARHMAVYGLPAHTSASEHAAWHSNVFQFAASVLVACGSLEDAWLLADQAVTLAQCPDAEQRYVGSSLGTALYQRARIAVQMSQQASGMSTRRILLEKAYADGTEALAYVSEPDNLHRAAIHACLAEVLALLNGYSTDLAAHFDQALALAPDEPVIDVAGVSPSMSMILHQRARTTLHLHDQQQAQPAGDFSLDGAARDVHEAIRRLPMYQEWRHLNLLATQVELALARDSTDETALLTHEVACLLAFDHPGSQRIAAWDQQVMQRMRDVHPELFDLAA
jgi:hypothetical protein